MRANVGHSKYIDREPIASVIFKYRTKGGSGLMLSLWTNLTETEALQSILIIPTLDPIDVMTPEEMRAALRRQRVR